MYFIIVLSCLEIFHIFAKVIQSRLLHVCRIWERVNYNTTCDAGAVIRSTNSGMSSFNPETINIWVRLKEGHWNRIKLVFILYSAIPIPHVEAF